MKPDLLRHSALSLMVALLTTAQTHAQVSPDDALAGMKVADGLEVTLFAAEPDLRNPTAMDIDAAGRVWVTEAVNYRLFNQSVADESGDRIRVLEDTDGDGRCDKAWTYYQDPSLQSPMGIAVLGDRVYVCQSPDLFYLRDTDGDGRADEKTVVLTGFGGVDHDHAIHGVTFGPDGLLYFSVGDQGLDVTDKSGKRITAGRDAPYQAATVFRTDLEGQHLELLASNMRNPYAPAVDSFGNVYISDNDDDGNEQTRINYVIEGGNYGYWPRRKGDRRLDAVHWNMDRAGTMPPMLKTGFGSPTGMAMYEGELLPERFRDTVLHTDAGPGVLRSYRPIPDGAGFRAEAEVILSCPDDKWFRPSDVSVAPDGSVFVADWYDPGVGGHRMADVAQGRVYRLAPPGLASKTPAVDLATDDGLAAALGSPNHATRYLAHKAIDERLDDEDWDVLTVPTASDFATTVTRTLWFTVREKSHGIGVAARGLTKSNPVQARVMAIRLAAATDIALLNELRPKFSSEHPQVRRQVLVEMARAHEWRPWMNDLLVELALLAGDDRFYLEAISIAARGREEWLLGKVMDAHNYKWDELTARLAFHLHPSSAFDPAHDALLRSDVSPDLRALALNTLDAIGTPEAGECIVAALTHDNVPATLRVHALHLLSRDEGDAWRSAGLYDRVDDAMATLLPNTETKDAAWQFIYDTRRVKFITTGILIAADEDAVSGERIKALSLVERLASRIPPNGTHTHIQLVTPVLGAADEAIASAAVDAVAAFRGEASEHALGEVAMDRGYAPKVRRAAVTRLAQSRSGATMLVKMAKEDEIPADMTLAVSEQLHRSNWEDIRLMAQQVLPRETSREGVALPPLDELAKRNGDATRGRAVFFSEERSQCYTCHKFNGEGREVGPDLSKIGEKLGRQGLLESILNPSAAISHEYKVWMFRSKSRGHLSGYIRSESDERLELMESTGETINLDQDDIIERWESELSLMPSGLTAGMSVDELVDLVGYLETLR